MKKVIYISLFFALATLSLNGQTLSTLRDVEVLPQPEEDRIITVIQGSTSDSQTSLFELSMGKIGAEALSRGLAGFYIIDKDIQSTEVIETFEDSKKQIQVIKRTKYKVKLTALLVAEPRDGMGEFIPAAAAQEKGAERSESNLNVTCVGTVAACAILVGVLIYEAAKPK